MLFRLALMFKISVISLLSLAFVASFLVVGSSEAATKTSTLKQPTILVYGDSLSAAYGLPKEQGWVASLQKQLNKQHYLYSVVNASVSGETTSGGLSRFANTLAKTKPSIVIVELGANDGLRGLPIQEMSNNLNKMLELSKKADAKVLLLGMRIPPNYGLEYTKTFTETYTQLSKKHNATLVPFMLENIAAKPQLIQDDGLHPNALGQAIILENVWPYLSKLLNAKCLAKAN